MEDGYNEIKAEIYRSRIARDKTEKNIVRNYIGIQSQFYRYAVICCRLHGDDFESNRSSYFRAWTIRGTLHIHHIEDYNLVIYRDMLTPYMHEFWDNEQTVSISEKRYYREIILESLRKESLTKNQLIDLCISNGMTPEKKEYLFNPWGGMPRYLIETGKIILTCNSNASYVLAPEAEQRSREEAEAEQLRRYLKGYGPCTLEDVMYFFKWNKKKSKMMLDHVLEQYYPDENVIKKVGDQEYIFIDRYLSGRNADSADELYVLSAFDPLLLGYEKKCSLFFRKEHIREIFTLQGIVKPTILYRGEISGIWNIKDKKIYVRLFRCIPQECLERMEEILKSATEIRNIIIDKIYYINK